MLDFQRQRNTYQNQNKPNDSRGIAGWIFDAHDSKDVIDGLKKSRHDDHPAIAFAVDDCLRHMTCGGQSEKNREEISGSG